MNNADSSFFFFCVAFKTRTLKIVFDKNSKKLISAYFDHKAKKNAPSSTVALLSQTAMMRDEFRLNFL